jgi:hypothetical protein
MTILHAAMAVTKPALTRGGGRPKIEWRNSATVRTCMRFAMPQLATIVLLVHMGLGCCWHHAHACVAHGHAPHAGGEGCACEASHPPLCEHRCDHADGPDAPGGHEGHEHQCDGDRCEFVRSKPFCDEGRDGNVNAIAVPSVAPAMECPLKLNASTMRAATSPGGLPLPLRAHLLFCVLLI